MSTKELSPKQTAHLGTFSSNRYMFLTPGQNNLMTQQLFEMGYIKRKRDPATWKFMYMKALDSGKSEEDWG